MRYQNGYRNDMNLSAIPLRTPMVIDRVDGERAFRRRLMELGFLPGVEVEVLGVAPFGDPLDIAIRGCRFSLRSAEAASIQVRSPEAPTAQPR
jgi:ferrous iron transport protein A